MSNDDYIETEISNLTVIQSSRISFVYFALFCFHDSVTIPFIQSIYLNHRI